MNKNITELKETKFPKKFNFIKKIFLENLILINTDYCNEDYIKIDKIKLFEKLKF
ncbi:MAG: hypothetical protein ABF289_07260 [Clostridiales bacterium]